MFATSKLNTLRKRHYGLDGLPSSICVLAPDQLASSLRSIEVATLDEVAFAIVKAEQAYNAAGDRLVGSGLVVQSMLQSMPGRSADHGYSCHRPRPQQRHRCAGF